MRREESYAQGRFFAALYRTVRQYIQGHTYSLFVRRLLDNTSRIFLLLLCTLCVVQCEGKCFEVNRLASESWSWTMILNPSRGDQASLSELTCSR